MDDPGAVWVRDCVCEYVFCVFVCLRVCVCVCVSPTTLWAARTCVTAEPREWMEWMPLALCVRANARVKTCYVCLCVCVCVCVAGGGVDCVCVWVWVCAQLLLLLAVSVARLKHCGPHVRV